MTALAQNPFKALIEQVTSRRHQPHRGPMNDDAQRPTTKTGAMRKYLKRAGRATAADLAIEAGVEGNSGLVWALLKSDIAKGAIVREGCWYVWNQDFDQAELTRIQEAIRTLRAAGYTVSREAA